MKLADHHSCDAFATDQERNLSAADMSLARDITASCREMLSQTANRMVQLGGNLRQFLVDHEYADDDKRMTFCPWTLDCVYQAAVTLAWFGSAASAENASAYATKKEVCLDILQRANAEWKVAGKIPLYSPS